MCVWLRPMNFILHWGGAVFFLARCAFRSERRPLPPPHLSPLRSMRSKPAHLQPPRRRLRPALPCPSQLDEAVAGVFCRAPADGAVWTERNEAGCVLSAPCKSVVPPFPPPRSSARASERRTATRHALKPHRFPATSRRDLAGPTSAAVQISRGTHTVPPP